MSGTAKFALARAPLRVSLGGGGTDLPSYATRRGGMVVGVAIDRYVGVAVYPREFTGAVRTAFEGRVRQGDPVDHPDPLARACLRRFGPEGNLQVASFGDAPSGSGLGGSGAFTVAFAHAASAGVGLSTRDMAETAADIEIRDLRRPVGKQDHYLAAFGGLRVLHFPPEGEVRVEAPAVAPETAAELQSRLLLFHSGISRDAAEVLAEQNDRTLHGDREVVSGLDRIRDIADEMTGALTSGEVDAVGPLIDEHWKIKSRFSSRICPPRVAALYDLAMRSGATGGKLLGSGGGGFLLVFCRADGRERVRRALTAEGCRELPFGFDHEGSRVSWLPV